MLKQILIQEECLNIEIFYIVLIMSQLFVTQNSCSIVFVFYL